jgi:hypothetical protein
MSTEVFDYKRDKRTGARRRYRADMRNELRELDRGFKVWRDQQRQDPTYPHPPVWPNKAKRGAEGMLYRRLMDKVVRVYSADHRMAYGRRKAATLPGTGGMAQRQIDSANAAVMIEKRAARGG